MKYLIAVLVIILMIFLCIRARCTNEARMSDLPHVFLWAWERPDDLRTVPSDIGVAYLAATLRIVGDRVMVLPRMQPLMVPRNVALISVIRIEVDEHDRTELTDQRAQQISNSICKFANLPRTRAVQVDFDARQNERNFYGRLLRYLRAALPASQPLSITALASWCMCDNWMQKLPIDESVPMFFSMGSETHNVLTDVALGRRFGDSRCDLSLGLSLDEPGVNAVALPAARQRNLEQPIRLYVFSSKKWSDKSILRALQLAKGLSSK
jgi:hypothetical protein